MNIDALFQRGPQITFARVVTPSQMFHAYTVRAGGPGVVEVEWHGRVYVRLTDVEAEEALVGWRVEGTAEDGTREAWKVTRLSCGCQHSAPVSADPAEVVPQPEKNLA